MSGAAREQPWYHSLILRADLGSAACCFASGQELLEPARFRFGRGGDDTRMIRKLWRARYECWHTGSSARKDGSYASVLQAASQGFTLSFWQLCIIASIAAGRRTPPDALHSLPGCSRRRCAQR